MGRPRTLLLGLVLGAVLSAPAGANGQLLSPGKLSTAHASVEGLRNCTACHELGKRGIAPDRCLNCHLPLAGRIEANEGFHATVSDADCADCHQEHLGVDFDVRRFDENAFTHTDAGYELRLSHAEVTCRGCHVAKNIADPGVVAFKREHGALDRTFLGLTPGCAGCHETDSPHGNQFSDRSCEDCHDEGDWQKPPNFDHSVTAYPLDGAHQSVSCEGCHGADAGGTGYSPLAFGACNDCHQDPHAGAMKDTCASCHRTAGWLAVSTANVERRFDHATTRFPLVDAHAMADCAACHQRGRPPRSALLSMSYQPGTQNSTYPRPRFDSCRSCHVEQHADANAPDRWTDCSSCHSQAAFTPSPFTSARHAEGTFPLTGAHLVTPCVDCHQDTEQGHASFTLALPAQDCVACHQADDPHDGMYAGRACAECHTTDAFVAADFNHELVTTGPDARACASCHVDRDPHGGQFEGEDCASCHETETFAIVDFNHALVGFPLDGAHADAACQSCHVADSSGIVRYRPLGKDCTDCHGGVS